MPQATAVPTTGQKVRSALALAGLRQADAAQVLGISQVQVSKRINGHVAFQPSELEKLAALCRVPLRTLEARPARRHTSTTHPDRRRAMARKGEPSIKCEECNGELFYDETERRWRHVRRQNDNHEARHPLEKR